MMTISLATADRANPWPPVERWGPVPPESRPNAVPGSPRGGTNQSGELTTLCHFGTYRLHGNLTGATPFPHLAREDDPRVVVDRPGSGARHAPGSSSPCVPSFYGSRGCLPNLNGSRSAEGGNRCRLRDGTPRCGTRLLRRADCKTVSAVVSWCKNASFISWPRTFCQE